MTYTVVDTEVVGARIVFTAENDNGDIFKGRVNERIASNTYLTDKALEQLSEQLLGQEVDVDSIDVRDAEFDIGFGDDDEC